MASAGRWMPIRRPTALHGGQAGFHRQRWQIKELESDRIKLALLSRDGDQGFPGNLKVTLEYRLEQQDLVVEFRASTDAPTPVSLTSHAYFNLDGDPDGGDVRDHLISINADRFLPTDPSGLPLAVTQVEGPFDLRRERPIGQDWLSHPQQQQAKGYDHGFVLNGPAQEWAARVVSADKQLAMEVYTNQPSLQFLYRQLAGQYPQPQRSVTPGSRRLLS